jgi:hypothetical protein
MAIQESVMFEGWDGYDSDTIEEFVRAHHADER